MAKPSSTRTSVFICILLLLAVLAVYGQVAHFQFVRFDDKDYVIRNNHVRSGLSISNILWAMTAYHASNWHPLTWISHMLDVQLWGMNPGAHHLTNVFLHIMSTLLLFTLIIRMTGRTWAAAFVAALFALHPQHVESVAWVAERKDVLSTFFCMLALLAYVNYARHRDVGRYMLAALFFALGLLAKPMLVTLPVIMLLLDYWPLDRFSSSEQGKRSSIKSLIIEKIPFFMMTAASCYLTMQAQKAGEAVRSTAMFSPGVRVANALVSYVVYLKKMFYPHNLYLLYTHPGNTLPLWQVIGSGAIIVLITALALRSAKRYPYLAVGWLWYMISLLPVIGLIQVGMQAMADRYMYIPSIGLSIIIAWGAPDLIARLGVKRHTGLILAVPSVTVLTILGICAWSQTGTWRDTASLSTHAQACCGVGQNVLWDKSQGQAAIGDLDRAERKLRDLIDRNPRNAQAHYDLGVILDMKGSGDEAVKEYEESLRLDPRNADAHNNLGTAMARRGDMSAAEEHFRQAVRLSPSSARSCFNLGIALFKEEKYDESITQLRRAADLDPKMENARLKLGYILLTRERLAEAEIEFRKALRVNPKSPDAYIFLGQVQQQRGNIDGSIESLSTAIKLAPDRGEPYYYLAMSRAQQGKYAEAWKELELSRARGVMPDPRFVERLSRVMPEPGS